MPEAWGIFFAQMGEHRASIVFNDAIADEIDQLSHLHSVWVLLDLRGWNDDGLTTDAEAERLGPLETEIERCFVAYNGMLLGRVTTNRKRWIMGLADTDAVCGDVERAMQRAGYDGEVRSEPDPEKSIYWDDLYPTPDDRQVMNDMSVLSVLGENGDHRAAQRDVEHVSEFEDRSAADAYAVWARESGYRQVERQDDHQSAGGRFRVLSVHTGTMQLDDITRHSLAHRRKAADLGGRYDGWETELITEISKP